MLAFLLDTKTGHLLIGVLCISLAGAGCYWRGHNKGWDAATEHYSAVVAACMAANSQDEKTIEQLQKANDSYARSAAAQAAEIAEAKASMQTQAKASARALDVAQHKLSEAIHETPQAIDWADRTLPPAVAGSLRE